jgi:hypothetical protein
MFQQRRRSNETRANNNIRSCTNNKDCLAFGLCEKKFSNGTWTFNNVQLNTITVLQRRQLYSACEKQWIFQNRPVHGACKFHKRSETSFFLTPPLSSPRRDDLNCVTLFCTTVRSERTQSRGWFRGWCRCYLRATTVYVRVSRDLHFQCNTYAQDDAHLPS